MNEEVNALEEKIVDLASTMIQIYYDSDRLNINEEKHKKIVSDIMKISTEEVLKMHKTVKNDVINSNKLVKCGDLVILSIDNGEPTRYLITTNPNYYSESTSKVRLHSGLTYESNTYETIYAYSCLGLHLIDKCVGDTVDYVNNEDKNQHHAKILERITTELSANNSAYEFMANITAANKK